MALRYERAYKRRWYHRYENVLTKHPTIRRACGGYVFKRTGEYVTKISGTQAETVRIKPDPRCVGTISAEAYREASEDPNVQATIARARESWRERYGYDPAENRMK